MIKKVLLAIVVQFLAFSAIAASGKAHFAPFEIYYFSGDNFKRAWVNVSNITNAPVVVSLTLYDEHGNVVVDSNNSSSVGPLRAQYNFSNYSESVQGKSAEFTLAAHSSARFDIQGNSDSTIMYGKIEWSQESDALVALISNIKVDRFYRQTSRQSGQSHTVLVNNGNPF